MTVRLARKRAGFTLLELVVVLGILVILAGLVVGKLDILSMKANKGVSASNMAGVSRYVQLHRINNTTYPNNWDSLINPATNGLWGAGTTTTPSLDPQAIGTSGPAGASPNKLTTFTLAGGATGDGQLRSLVRMGITQVLDLGASTSPPGNAFDTVRALTSTARLATLRVQPYVAAGSEDGDAVNILNSIYPQLNGTTISAVPAGKQLVVLGLGPRNTLVGADGLLMEAPFYANTQHNQYYDRFLCVFELSDSGSRAKLVAVLGSDGDQLKEEIADFYE